MAMRPDVAAARQLMKSKGGSRTSIKRLSRYLQDDETVALMAQGHYGGEGSALGLVVLTDHRVLLLRPEFLRTDTQDIPLAAITSVKWSSKLSRGSMSIVTAGDTAEITGIYVDDGQAIVTALRQAATR